MATYDQLSSEQRAILDLLLRRGQGYDELADTLGIPVVRVRELACEALTTLAPVSAEAVEEGWRGKLADYLLNQQPGPEAAATRGHLRRSEAARGWARSVLDSLSHLYGPGEIPSVPAGDAAVERAPGAGARSLTPEAQALVKRRRIIGGAALAILLALFVLVWPIGLVTGDGDDASGDGADQAEPELLGQLPLLPPSGGNKKFAGIAIFSRQGDGEQIGVQAQLKATKQDSAYQVWLYNSKQDAKSLGAQYADAQGLFSGIAKLPENYERYKFIDVSREEVEGDPSHSGQTVLRGEISKMVPVEEDSASTTTTPAP